MARRYVNLPVEEEHKTFCDFMEYPLELESNGCYIYNLPANHICRFLINYENWKLGIFNKDDFIKMTDV